MTQICVQYLWTPLITSCGRFVHHVLPLLTAFLSPLIPRITPPSNSTLKKVWKCRSVGLCFHAFPRRVYVDSKLLPGYIADKDGEPLLPPGMREHLYEDLNQSFDF